MDRSLRNSSEKYFDQDSDRGKICDHRWRVVPFVIATTGVDRFPYLCKHLIEAHEKLRDTYRWHDYRSASISVISEIGTRVDGRRNSFRQLFHFYRQENSYSLRFIRSNDSWYVFSSIFSFLLLLLALFIFVDWFQFFSFFLSNEFLKVNRDSSIKFDRI